MLDATSSKNGIGQSRRSRSSTLISPRFAAMSWIHFAGLSPKRVARVVLMITAIFGLAIHALSAERAWTGKFTRAHAENRVGCLPATLFANAIRSSESDPR